MYITIVLILLTIKKIIIKYYRRGKNKIISGTARGTKLYTLEGQSTRPTLDRVKESVFNIIQNKINGSIFLDLFSGSGAIGLEAGSRGAKKVILCDKSKEAIKIIKRNIEKTHLEKIVELYNLDYDVLLKKEIKEKLDYIYIDPPYASDFAIKSLEIISQKDYINEQTTIIVETDDEKNIIQNIKNTNLEIIDKRKYGRAIILFLKINPT